MLIAQELNDILIDEVEKDQASWQLEWKLDSFKVSSKTPIDFSDTKSSFSGDAYTASGRYEYRIFRCTNPSFNI